MIEFLTLFLGLTTGPQTVALAGDDQVAAVEVRLDGQAVATDREPPWEVAVDLGTRLMPRVLEAVAYDGEGRVLSRATQTLNVPRPPAEARLWIDSDPADGAPTARLAWESSLQANPTSVEAWLDGEEVPVTGLDRIALPAVDPKEAHLLQAELSFSRDVKAQAQILFGGAYAETVETELTALPVVPRGRGRFPDPGDMKGWFLDHGSPLGVVAVESGRSDLVVVRGPGVDRAMRDLVGTVNDDLVGGIGSSTPLEGAGGAIQGMQGSWATAAERLRRSMPLERGQRLRLLVPHARRQEGRQLAMEAFAISPEITREMGGMFWVLHQELTLPGMSSRLRVADAVAVAGLQAASGNRRRAVLLVLADDVQDESRFTAAAVRDYLASLAVPLVVWRLGGEGAGPEWGPGERIGNFRNLQRAARGVEKTLESQRIVWLAGRHLVDRIEIAPAARAERVASGGV